MKSLPSQRRGKFDSPVEAIDVGQVIQVGIGRRRPAAAVVINNRAHNARPLGVPNLAELRILLRLLSLLLRRAPALLLLFILGTIQWRRLADDARWREHKSRFLSLHVINGAKRMPSIGAC